MPLPTECETPLSPRFNPPPGADTADGAIPTARRPHPKMLLVNIVMQLKRKHAKKDRMQMKRMQTHMKKILIWLLNSLTLKEELYSFLTCHLIS